MRETGLAAGGVVDGVLIVWLLARLVVTLDLPAIPWARRAVEVERAARQVAAACTAATRRGDW